MKLPQERFPKTAIQHSKFWLLFSLSIFYLDCFRSNANLCPILFRTWAIEIIVNQLFIFFESAVIYIRSIKPMHNASMKAQV